MAKYKVLRKCFWGKKWEVGEVVELNNTPPKHFELVEENLPVTTVINIEKTDLTKSVEEYGEISSYSEANKRVGIINKGGFASSLAHEKPITSFRELKRKPKGK